MEDKKQAEDFIKLNAALNVVNNSILHGNKKTIDHLPHRINLQKLGDLLKYSDRYELSIQFWPEQIAVYIAKDGVELTSYGGGFSFAITKSIEYLKRINREPCTK